MKKKLGHEAMFLLSQNEIGIRRIILAELLDLTFFFEPWIAINEKA